MTKLVLKTSFICFFLAILMLFSSCSHTYHVQTEVGKGCFTEHKSFFPKKNIALTMDSVQVKGFSPIVRCLTEADIKTLKKQIPQKYRRHSPQIYYPRSFSQGDNCDGLYSLDYLIISKDIRTYIIIYFIKMDDYIITQFSNKKITRQDIEPLGKLYDEKTINEIINKFNQEITIRRSSLKYFEPHFY